MDSHFHGNDKEKSGNNIEGKGMTGGFCPLPLSFPRKRESIPDRQVCFANWVIGQ